MATPRITLRKRRDILRLRLDAGLSIRQIQAVTKASIGLIQKFVARAEALRLDWPLPAELDDNKLQALFYPAPNSTNTERFEQPDCAGIYQSLKHKGVTLKAIHAPGPQGRRKMLCRLLWSHNTNGEPTHRREPYKPGLRGCARCLQLHLC